jgi:hypothetical protein
MSTWLQRKKLPPAIGHFQPDVAQSEAGDFDFAIRFGARITVFRPLSF